MLLSFKCYFINKGELVKILVMVGGMVGARGTATDMNIRATL